MESREYWNAPDARKKYLVHSNLVPLIYFVIVSVIYFPDPNVDALVILVALGLLWLLYNNAMSHRVVSHPLCRLTDELIILNHDRNVIPWNVVTRVIWFQRKHEARIYYRSPPGSESQREHSASIEGKWLLDQDAFIYGLKKACEEHSTEFTMR